MRVLFAHETLGSLGGAEANVMITSGELVGKGWTVGLLARRSSGKAEENWNQRFQPHCYLGDDEATTRRALEEFQPDVIYVHKWDQLPTLDLILSHGVPALRMVHDHDIYCMRSYKYNPLTREVCHRPASPYCVFPCLAFVRLSRTGFPLSYVSYPAKRREIEMNKRFAKHLVVTEYMRDELAANGIARENIEIYPPVPRAVEPLTSTFSDRNLLLYIGQITRGKGVDLLLKALARTKEKFELIVLGDGHHLEYCKKLSHTLGLSDRVQFKGFIPQEQLRAYCAEASVVLISSVWPEPIATVGLEVMRFGLPVIAFDAGGIRDWLKDGENGRLVPWSDLDAYASAVDSLLRDKALARTMGEAGRVRVNRDYDFNEYIERLHQLLLTHATAATT
jgi:glycosyltransferase involved in cell wall biosynthesis